MVKKPESSTKYFLMSTLHFNRFLNSCSFPKEGTVSLFCGDSTTWSRPFWRFLRAQGWKPSLGKVYCFLFHSYTDYDCVNLYEPQYKGTFLKKSFFLSVLKIHLYNVSFHENKLSTIWAKCFSSTQGWLLVVFGRVPLYPFYFKYNVKLLIQYISTNAIKPTLLLIHACPLLSLLWILESGWKLHWIHFNLNSIKLCEVVKRDLSGPAFSLCTQCLPRLSCSWTMFS